MNGVLVVDKPRGLTSHDVVAVARRALRETAIGHTGTLDPLATGVLPLACGRATRLVRFLSASDKDYDATIRFGMSTDTYDITGTQTSATPDRPTRDAVEAAVASLRGRYLQMPPPYSAKKVGGRRAYDLARRAEPVALTPVPVNVSRAEVGAFDGQTASVTLTSSAGFYVRSFAHELGQRVGTGACLEALRRTRSGEFGLDLAIPFETLAEPPGDALAAGRSGPAAALIPMRRLLQGLPAVWLTEEGRQRVSHGREVGPAHWRDPDMAAMSRLHDVPDDARWVRLLDADGELVALGRPTAIPGALHPSVVLA